MTKNERHREVIKRSRKRTKRETETRGRHGESRLTTPIMRGVQLTRVTLVPNSRRFDGTRRGVTNNTRARCCQIFYVTCLRVLRLIAERRGMVLAYALKAPEGHYVSASTTFSPCLSVLRYLVIDPRFPLLEASAVLPTERQREMVPPSLGDETSKH